MAKVTIANTFHRFVPAEGRPNEEKREDYPAGITVDASDEDAADWLAKGLAVEPVKATTESAAE